MILIFDTETTGLPKNYYAPASEVDNWPRLVQLAWQIYDIEGKLLEESDNIIKPTDFVIPDEATKVHGISNNRALNSGKDLKNVLTKFRNLIEKADVVVGHNIEFDLNIIKAEFYRAKILDSYESLEIICTMKSTTNLCKIEHAYYGYKYPSLNELHIYLFGTSVNGSHNAQVDVYYTAKCFWKLRELGFYEDNFTKLIGREALIKTSKRWKSLNSTERNNLTKLYNGLYNKPEYIYELLDKTALVTRKSPDLTSLIGIGRIRKLETLNISFTKIKDLAGIQSLDLKYRATSEKWVYVNRYFLFIVK
ncbi:MAG: 3'-5' exonuclease [Lentimicrobium sp.]